MEKKRRVQRRVSRARVQAVGRFSMRNHLAKSRRKLRLKRG